MASNVLDVLPFPDRVEDRLRGKDERCKAWERQLASYRKVRSACPVSSRIVFRCKRFFYDWIPAPRSGSRTGFAGKTELSIVMPYLMRHPEMI